MATRTTRRAATRRQVVDDDSDVENETSQTHDETIAEELPASKRVSRRRVSEEEEISQIASPPESVIDEPVSTARKTSSRRRSIKDVRAARKQRISIAQDIEEEEEASILPTPKATQSPEPQSAPLSDITESTINEQVASTTTEDVSMKSIDPDAKMADDYDEENIKTPRKNENIDVTITKDLNPVSATVPPTPKTVRKLDSQNTVLERPMDIVVRTRALGIPQTTEAAEAKPRMTITYLTLMNFKSYAGKQVVGPFHASFSSVVGPNGSGKSNVIDSLLFVFGFRASKMRQGKISALIHNSAAYPDLDYCEVEVHFQEVMDQPGGATSVVPDSQLIVSRRAFKNNSSKYYINGRNSDFTAVTSLLKGRGIDLDHKRFLILQGEVESIAQMKPKASGEHDDGLLEYLEDIIGTSKYKTPIDEAAAETEQLNEICLEKSGRVQHVEKEKNGLEDKKNKALAYIRDENELATKQSALYQIYVAECGDNLQVTKEAVQQIQQQLDEEQERHNSNEAEIKQLQSDYKSNEKQYEKLEKSTEGIIKEMAKLDKDAVKLQEKKRFLLNKNKKTEKTLDAAKFGIEESSTLAEQAEQDTVRLTKEIKSLETDMEKENVTLTKIRDELKGKTQGLSDEIAAKQQQLEPWNAKIAEKTSNIAIVQSELQLLQGKLNAGANATSELETKITALEEQQAAKTEELENCRAEKTSVQQELSSVQQESSKTSKQVPILQAKLSNARQQADEARSSLAATQSQGNVLAGLSRLQESGRINGFHGRLGNLGAIDAKYDVAVSTAAPSLESLVVDTVEVGQQCIEYLRKNNLGRANFILLDRLPQYDLGPIQTPENVPRLYDLIKTKDDRFLPGFFNAVQNTLVAKDLAQANRIAYGAKRWRVVTLAGELIDKSGTMSGGGTRIARGAMSSKIASTVSKEQVSKMEVDRDALEKEMEELQDVISELSAKISTLDARIPELDTMAQKLSLDIDSIRRNIVDAEKRKTELLAAQQPSQAEKSKISGLESSIASSEAEVTKLQEETVSIEEEIQALQDKIMEIGGVRLRGQKAKVDGLKEQIDLLSETLNSAEVAKYKAETKMGKHQQAQQTAEAEHAKAVEELEGVEEEIRTQHTDTSESRQRAEAAQQRLEDEKEKLEQLKVNLDQQIADLNENRGVEVELKNKLEDNKKVLADNQKRLKYWQEKLSTLTLQNISEEGEEKEPEAVPELSRDELEDLDKEDLKASIAGLEERTSQHVEVGVLAEYRRRVNEYTSRMEDLNTALTTRDGAKKRTDDLRRLRLEGFMEGFSVISLRLKEMYQMITMGGNAELELVDSLDPFSEGILFSVMPPKKSWKNISNLSGGEKTLSSLALVFALHHYKPTPLYVMDEIDAALDFRNVSSIITRCDYIKLQLLI
ncbi:hypothetical protein MRB53_037253 [Persea americana]|nr:hypothetical protein MRB53_037253 [Persea americana]